jgi:hypothetical protein
MENNTRASDLPDIGHHQRPPWSGESYRPVCIAEPLRATMPSARYGSLGSFRMTQLNKRALTARRNLRVASATNRAPFKPNQHIPMVLRADMSCTKPAGVSRRAEVQIAV